MPDARSFPRFDPSRYDDELDPAGRICPFARCDHALAALRAGDAATALATLTERRRTRDLADRLAGEAENLIRAGLIADALRRLECAAEPKFQSEADAREAYRLAQIAAEQPLLPMGIAA